MNQTQKEKIIKDIRGVKKERDFSIIEYQALNPHATYQEIKEALKLDIAEVTLGAIVANNWDKVLQIFALDNYIAMPEGRAFERARAFFNKKKNGIDTKKDPLDILNDMEDDSAKIDQSRHLTIVYGHRTTNDSPLRDKGRCSEPTQSDPTQNIRVG